jgi:hypothetical protein
MSVAILFDRGSAALVSRIFRPFSDEPLEA